VTNINVLIEAEEIYAELVRERTTTIVIISVSIVLAGLAGFGGFMIYKKKKIVEI